MKHVRIKDTALDLALRKLLFAAGLRYRTHSRPKVVALGLWGARTSTSP
ncbi:hypothetical protein [Pseudomonas sp. GOM7]